jgi:hypothetical protein
VLEEIDYRQGDPHLYPVPVPVQQPQTHQFLPLHLAELGHITSNGPQLELSLALPLHTDGLTSLPRLKPVGSPKPFRARESVGGRFSIERIAWAIQTNQVSHRALQTFFSYLESDRISEDINKEVEGVPAIFYAVESNREDILQAWIRHGGDVNARRGPAHQPLLAFAVLLAERLRSDTTALVVTLLTSGADANVIPREIYSPVLQDVLSTNSTWRGNIGNSTIDTTWYTEDTRQKLISSVTITQKYNFHKNAIRKKASPRLIHAAAQLKITPLLGLPYKMVGQDIAVSQLFDELLGYLATRSLRPLVLFFAGPSGHGKSELSKLLGSLLALPWLSIDMSGVKRETDLFGPKAPFVGHQEGSTLNNFISHHSGKRVVVFLDEFEKSSKEVWDALLLPFGEGGSSACNAIHVI